MIIRGEISDAIKDLLHVNASHHTTKTSVKILETLLEEEERQYNLQLDDLDDDGDDNHDNGTAESKDQRLKLLVRRAAQIVRGIPGLETTSGREEEENTSDANAFTPHISVNPQSPPAVSLSKDDKSRRMFDRLMRNELLDDLPSFGRMVEYGYDLSYPGITAPNGLASTTQPALYDHSDFDTEFS